MSRVPRTHRGSHTAASPRCGFGCFLLRLRPSHLTQSSERCDCSGCSSELARGHKDTLRAPCVLTPILFAPRFPRGWAPQPPGTHPVPGMSLWLGRVWGGMRLCGSAASLARVATKQREVFRRLCNMYTVTPATACPQGISGA